MQVESPQDIVMAYANQIVWLERRLTSLKQAETSETDPVYVKVVTELTWCRTAHDRMKEIVDAPKGYWVLVLKSKAAGLQDKVGRVTYVNEKNGFATVAFDNNTHSHNLGLSNLQVISLPVPSERIPAHGMVVKFKGDSTDYVAIAWSPTRVFVESIASVHSGADEYTRFVKRAWRERDDLLTINGLVPI